MDDLTSPLELSPITFTKDLDPMGLLTKARPDPWGGLAGFRGWVWRGLGLSTLDSRPLRDPHVCLSSLSVAPGELIGSRRLICELRRQGPIRFAFKG